MLKFYYAKGSVSFAPHILLEDVKADYVAECLDLYLGEQKLEKYLSINPKGRVPALITDKGIITETIAILTYIAQTHPEANLLPADPFNFAKVQSFNSFIASTIHVAHAHKARGQRWANQKIAIENMKTMVTDNMYKYAKIIEKYFFKGPYVLGDNYSICDPYLALVTRWLYDDGVDIYKLPLILSHDLKMKQRPSVKKIIEIHK